MEESKNTMAQVDQHMSDSEFDKAIELLTKQREDTKTCTVEVWRKSCISHVHLLQYAPAIRGYNNWTEKAESSDKDWTYWGLRIGLGLGLRVRIEKALKALRENLENLSCAELKQKATDLLALVDRTYKNFQFYKTPLSMESENLNDMKLSWQQDDDYIFIDLINTKAEESAWTYDNCKVDFTSTQIVNLDMNGMKTALNIFGEIVQKESFYEFKDDNKLVVLSLCKNVKKLVWSNWKMSTNAVAGHCYPTSSKVKKDWDKISKDIDIERLQNKEYDCDPSMHFFKEIYGNADPEARQAMMKSYQTSGGTVL